jgi:hypothetical protein
MGPKWTESYALNLNIKTEAFSEYLKVVVSGDQSREDAFAVIRLIRTLANEQAIERVLVDGRELTSRLHPADIFSISEHLAESFGQRVRVALVYRQEFIDGFGETVAVSRGARFTVRATEKEALEWLLAP